MTKGIPRPAYSPPPPARPPAYDDPGMGVGGFSDGAELCFCGVWVAAKRWHKVVTGHEFLYASQVRFTPQDYKRSPAISIGEARSQAIEALTRAEERRATAAKAEAQPNDADLLLGFVDACWAVCSECKLFGAGSVNAYGVHVPTSSDCRLPPTIRLMLFHYEREQGRILAEKTAQRRQS